MNISAKIELENSALIFQSDVTLYGIVMYCHVTHCTFQYSTVQCDSIRQSYELQLQYSTNMYVRMLYMVPNNFVQKVFSFWTPLERTKIL